VWWPTETVWCPTETVWCPTETVCRRLRKEVHRTVMVLVPVLAQTYHRPRLSLVQSLVRRAPKVCSEPPQDSELGRAGGSKAEAQSLLGTQTLRGT